jgi:periplasmic protein TonB
MRTSTFFVSFLVHGVMVAVAVVVPLIATDALPQLRRSTTFVALTPEIPTVAEPRAQRQQRAPVSPGNRSAAPIVEPPEIGAETDVAPIDVPIGDGFVDGPLDLSGTVVSAPAIEPPPPATPAAPVRVGGAISPPQKLHHVAPEYPAIARSARVSGIVILEAVLGVDGAVRDVTVLRSIPLLDRAAVDAVRQWRFTPTLLNGQPVPVIMTVTVAFNLN